MYVTQLRDRYEEIERTGGGVAAIGMGRVEMAAHFRDEFEIPFPLLVDADASSYRLLEMKRGSLWDVVGPHMWMDFSKRLMKGQAPKGIQGDALQMGGVAVIETDGRISHTHRARNPADDLPVDELLRLLAGA